LTVGKSERRWYFFGKEVFAKQKHEFYLKRKINNWWVLFEENKSIISKYTLCTQYYY